MAVLPVGSFEQHGDFLPLTTDTVVACLISQALAETYDLRCLPPVTISCSQEHSEFAGTVSITARTLHNMIDDVIGSLTRQGVEALVLVNGHGGNYVLGNITKEANQHGPMRVGLFPGRSDWHQAREAAGMATNHHEDMHAGEMETSLLLHAHPELVGETYRHGDWLASDRTHLETLGMGAYTTSGVIGQPSLATPEKGKAAVEALVASFAAHHSVLAQ